MLLSSLMRTSLLISRRSICLSSLKLRQQRLDDGESDSEKWLKYASDNEDPLGGNISAFEDEFGNLIRPTGQLTKSMALRKMKKNLHMIENCYLLIEELLK